MSSNKSVTMEEAETSTDLEIGKVLEELRGDRLERIAKATAEIPILMEEIKQREKHIAMYEQDRLYCHYSLDILADRIALLEEE